MIYRYSQGHYIDSEGIKHNGLISFVDMNSSKVLFKEKPTSKTLWLDASSVRKFLWKTDVYESLKGKFYKRLNQSETKIKIYRNYYSFQPGKEAGLFKYYVSIENHLELTYFWSKSIKIY